MFTAKDRQKCLRLQDRYYAGRKFFDVLYREQIHGSLRSGSRILDAGCGRYLKLCKELSGKAHMVGIDLETTLETDNQTPPFGVRGDLSRLPFCSSSFDMVVSRSVVEHLSDPPQVFREFSRVLRPGGILVMVTPNKYDYVSLVATITPHWFHQRLVSRIFGVSEDDVFPTFYRANTRSAIRKAMAASGLIEKQLTSITHYPAYLAFSPILFRLGVLYERITSASFLAWLRSSILCVFEKPRNAPGMSHISGVPDRAPVEVP
jgi:ubiquinone/menaquinone biosynthesis C-methylase UbiE